MRARLLERRVDELEAVLASMQALIDRIEGILSRKDLL